MIADTFIKRPVTAIVISIVIVLVGLISLVNLPIAQYPEISPPTVNISGSYTGADAQTVEQTTTTAIETQVNGTPGMTYMTSNSTSSGQSGITVNFEVGTDINIATLDVQNRVSVAEPTLPDQVKRLGVCSSIATGYVYSGRRNFRILSLRLILTLIRKRYMRYQN